MTFSKLFSFNSKLIKLILFIIFVFFIYFYSRFLPNLRYVAELLLISFSFFLLDKKALKILFLIAIASLVFHWDLREYLILNIATINLIIYSSNKRILEYKDLLIFAYFVVVLLFLFVFINEILNLNNEILNVNNKIFFRNTGPFSSSLHLSYLLISLSLTIFVLGSPFFYKFYGQKFHIISNQSDSEYFSSSNSNKIDLIKHDIYKNIFLIIIFFLSIINGSRTAIIFTGIIILLAQYKLSYKLKLIFISTLLIIYLFFNIRVIGYEVGNDNVRIEYIIKYFDKINLKNFLVGEGRVNYGSLGVKFKGYENIYASESSIIMLLYTHGVFIAIILLYSIFRKLFILMQKNLLFIIPNLLIIFIFMLAPFFDSPGVGVINGFLLNQMFLNTQLSNSKNII
jgi:hypothetical protein